MLARWRATVFSLAVEAVAVTDYVDREKNAVNSEYQMQLRSDDWRGMAVTSVAVNPDHPDARFSIGSLETLGEGVQQALKTFFETEYSADQMVLVALSNQSLDEMEAWVTPMFSAVENRNLGPAPQTEPLFTPDSLPMQLYYQTIMDGYKLSYTFPVPATRDYYRQKPDQYISNLLGHEGEGSLYQRLKREGWIETLSAGAMDVDERNGLLMVSMDLTAAGYENLDKIHELFVAFEAEEQFEEDELVVRLREFRESLRDRYEIGKTLQ